MTGTPVIDLDSRTLFVDALVLPGGADGGAAPKHMIFALAIDTGAIIDGWPVDVEAVTAAAGGSFSSSSSGQRGALAVVNGMLFVPFGLLYGDCGNNHGWVVAVDVANPARAQAWATAYTGGGLWAPGGIASDSRYIYFATGNTVAPGGPNVVAAWGGGQALMQMLAGPGFGGAFAYFAPHDWQNLDNEGIDMAAGPIPFDLAGATPSHLAITFGGDGNAYLLDRTNLGGVGSALGAIAGAAPYASLHAANIEIYTAPALYTTPTATYVSFRGNSIACANTSSTLITLRIAPGAPPTLAPAWCAGSGVGSPMVTTSDGSNDAIVWRMGVNDNNRLQAFDGDTGAAIPFTGSTASVAGLHPYNPPIAAKGRIYVAGDGLVVAFTL